MDTFEMSDNKVVMHNDNVLRKKDLIHPEEKIFVGYFLGNAAMHSHDFIELVYVISGSATHYYKDGARRIGAGDCFLIDIGCEHAYKDESDDFKLINCLFQPSFLSDSVKDDEMFKTLACNVFMSVEGADKQDSVFVPAVSAKGIQAIFMQMIDEMTRKKLGYVEVLQSLLKVVLIYMFRGIAPVSQPKIVTDIIERINAGCDKKINVENISESMFFSPAYISRIFKKYTGENLSDYIREKRMASVAQKIANTDWSIDSILTDCGYKDKKGFYEQFFRFYGCTPGEYRRRNKK